MLSMKSHDLIKAQRKEQQLTQVELAKLSGLSVPTIRNLERGHGHIRSVQAVMSVLKLLWAWHPHDDTRSVGRSLADTRRAKSISQRKMAAYIGVTLPTIQALEQKFTGSIQNLDKYFKCLGIHQVLAHNKDNLVESKRRLVPSKNGHDQDLIFTPRTLAAQIIDHFSSGITGSILDPCRGIGAFYDQYPDHLDRRWCEITQGRDFLKWQAHVDWIITNPPWSQMRDFLNHGYNIADNIVFLSAMSHFTTKARVNDMRINSFGMKEVLYVPTPTNWPHSGFQTAAVHLQRHWRGPCQFHYFFGSD